MPAIEEGPKNGKNIVVCCDGTGNQYGATNTNVVKLFEALDLDDPTRQVGYYDPGVGTGNPRGAITRTRRFFGRVLGLAFGTGIYRNIADAYEYLMETFEEDDRVYVFGFSRGAYTARALTGLLRMCGLLQPGSRSLVPYALEMFRKRVPKKKDKKEKHWAVAAGFKNTYARTCKPHFIGVWDTVKSVGIWDALKLMTKWQTALPFTYAMPDVAFGRHAISIDEKRSRFRPNMWERRADGSMQQVWFAGVHCDVGGGYPEDGLSDIALEWVLKGAEHRGLLLRKDAYAKIDGKATQDAHNSLKLFWMPLGWKRRKVRGPGAWDDATRTWEERPPSVHASVEIRKEETGYEPKLPPGTKYVSDAWEDYSET
ncbi:MAG: DUF2235 domain-containing protein [Planctomycetota bacterium]|jgi:uncharacterized protein (DUF2235 family)